MGSLMTVDPWLLDLGAKSEAHASIARQLGTAQARVSSALGHIIALNDEMVRDVVTKEARMGRLATIKVRCIRCHAYASLKDWVRSSGFDAKAREIATAQIRTKSGDLAAYFLIPCPGAEHAIERVDLLNQLDGKEDGPWTRS